MRQLKKLTKDTSYDFKYILSDDINECDSFHLTGIVRTLIKEHNKLVKIIKELQEREPSIVYVDNDQNL